MPAQPVRPLNADVAMPLLGLGTYLIPDAEVAGVVLEALRTGYRHVDTAEYYANESGVGAGLRAAMGELGLRREDVFVTTKLAPGNAAWGQTPKTKATTITSLEASLDRLGLDHVDLYLIHAPFHPDQRRDQWEGMVELKARGLARAIGVSNFNIGHIEELERAGLPRPEANQIELHPWSQKPELVGWLERAGVTPIAYSSLVPLSTWRRAPGQASAKSATMQQDSEGADSPFKAMAAAHGVSEAQVLLRWAVQHGWPVLPKSTRPDRLRQNADVFSFELGEAEMAALDRLDRGDGVAWPSGDPTRLA